MSCVEQMCVCMDDDFTTDIIFKCFIENNQVEYPYIVKYKYRAMVSIIFDEIMIPIMIISNFLSNSFRFE